MYVNKISLTSIKKTDIKTQVSRNAYENSDFVLFCDTFSWKI